MRVTVVGTGYVGLVSGTCFSEFGHEIICVDKDADKIERLKAGEIPIYEPGLDQLVEKNVREERLHFTTDLAEAVPGSDAVFIAVGTPSRRGDGHADLSYVYAAAEEIASLLEGYTVVVTKSTVPVGTGREIEKLISNIRPEADFDVASNPEFLREGAAIEDFMRPNRIVIGTDSARAREIMRDLYRPLYLNETPIVNTARETSELIKYASNAFLATKISFINEIADLCEVLGADVQDVARGMGLDKRIGPKFLHAGPGYGGSCFPKDTLALLRTGELNQVPLKIVEAVVDVNRERKLKMADRIIEACGGSVEGKKIAVLGLAFKPNTDDMRESPALDIIPVLQQNGAEVHAFDPAAMEEARNYLTDIRYASSPYDAMDGADALVIVTEWNEFRALDLKRVKSLLNSPLLVDLRNIYAKANPAAEGFDYYGVGKGRVIER
ncbi:UDP-glucose dehydrogenase family protein [Emcibacter nanhaiensis]|uniref:UDP-glucose 6-dehydrogenase n=1 Tax=Emcibacter nanhaiensis TaxID=1505037 RepID=A0A501PB25_9PROT|nr:UDP-glucose/GDP-mannose dehydrogenase family protein [Emcibacter nanhaiensis]TPD57425.1 UDP-glucose/GDP-mannose dehydrogenase family protein [Emcibacter nanhaiensis]